MRCVPKTVVFGTIEKTNLLVTAVLKDADCRGYHSREMGQTGGADLRYVKVLPRSKLHRQTGMYGRRSTSAYDPEVERTP